MKPQIAQISQIQNANSLCNLCDLWFNSDMSINLVGVTLHVADVDKSLEFYRKFPGAMVLFHMSGKFALLKLGQGRLGLLADTKRPMHVEIDCPNLDDAYKQFTEAGIKTDGPPTVKPWGERDFLVTDPDGNLIELGQQR